MMAAVGEFGVVDYVVFALMLLVSAAIGTFYAFCGGKQKSTKEYLLADRSMQSWPVAVSLLASYLSAITLLGAPSEIFTYGSQYLCMVFFSYWIFCGAVAVIFIPVFYQCGIVSVNEYLERRFSPGIRILGCVLYAMEYLLYMAVVLYAPALALEAVAGVPMTASIISTGVVCTFYTTMGGLKAVVWTDVFQTSVMVAGLITVCVIGSNEVGGISKVFKIADERGRLKIFDFNPDPTIRNTFWTLSIGGAFTAMPVWTVSQTAVQRFLAVKSLKAAKTAIWMNIPGLICVVSLCCLDGLVIFAVYSDCDLLSSGKVRSNDQVLPYFVVNKLGHLHGVPGVFTACLFAGALSTASSGLNSLSLVFLEDFIKKIMRDVTDEDAAKICKVIAIIFGVAVIGGAFLVQFAGHMVLQLAYSIFGILGGPLLGLFMLGMLTRSGNWRGAYCGVAAGVTITSWIFIGAYFYPPNKHPLPVSVQGCDNTTTLSVTNVTRSYDYDDPLSKLYSISYLWYSAVGIFTTLIVGYVLSLVLGHFFATEEERRKEVDPLLLFSFKKWFLSFLPGRAKSYGCDTTMEIPLEEKQDPYCEPITADFTPYGNETKLQDEEDTKSTTLIIH